MKKKYEVKTFMYKELKDLLEIPRYQRSPVWSDKKKIGLIETIKKGLPIGSLLIAKNGEKYQLIDGLQRISTLKDFEKDRFKYVNDHEITKEEIEKIIKSDKEADYYHHEVSESVKERIKDILIKTINDSANQNINDLSWNITNKLYNDISILSTLKKEKMQPVIYSLVDRINNILKIDDVELPTIIFKNYGENRNSELIEIFTKLNSEGVSLSKYDIFSATWQDVLITIDYKSKNKYGKEIIDSVIEKYQISSEKSGLEVVDLDDEVLKSTGSINIFEYAYALSKVIGKHSNFLYKASDESKVDSLGFTLLAGIFNLPNKDMNKLGEKINQYNIDYLDLVEYIVKIVGELEKTLETWVKSSDNKSYCSHSELQLASYILVLFKLTYNLDDKKIVKNQVNARQINQFKQFLHKHYLYDILRGYWTGSGDSKLDELMSEIGTNKYLYDVDRTSFENQILTWFDEQNRKVNKHNIYSDIKLFLNYIQSGTFASQEIKGKGFEFDHIVTKDSIKRHFTNKNISVPISTPSNLALIPKFDNRSKRELTYYQLLDLNNGLLDISESVLEKSCYPTRDELSFTTSVQTFTLSNYNIFLENRKKYLTNRILLILYPQY